MVADRAGLEAISDLPFAARLKTTEQQTPNISAARNLGASLAGGDILAYIDDDAVPEPTWLTHLVFPMQEPDCAATTGTVLGRNGISVQWANRWVDAQGGAHPSSSGLMPEGMAVKLEGTNMAVRREVLDRLGGFDEAFSFFLDETDLGWRLKEAGFTACFAPLATVHHGYAESARRRADRVPLDLTQIGQSTAHFLRKHAPAGAQQAALDNLRTEQAARLDMLVSENRLTAGNCATLLSGLEQGIEMGLRTQPELGQIAPKSGFTPLLDHPAPSPVVLTGRWFSRRRLTRRAQAMAQRGVSVSLFLMDHTMRAHRVQYQQPGIWIQSGGLFGPSDRSGARFQFWTFGRRMLTEQARLAKIRWI